MLKNLSLGLVAVVGAVSAADDAGVSYVEADKPFLEISDVNREAEAWAMCSAAYNALSEILSQEQPARAKQMNQLANGAEVAVTMSLFSDGLASDISSDRFESLWSAAKLSGTEIPKTSRTMLAAEAESNPDDFMHNMMATFEVCMDNISAQQMYIDMWRELAKSGMVRLPDQ